jgi:hypothetical protein
MLAADIDVPVLLSRFLPSVTKTRCPAPSEGDHFFRLLPETGFDIPVILDESFIGKAAMERFFRHTIKERHLRILNLFLSRLIV